MVLEKSSSPINNYSLQRYVLGPGDVLFVKLSGLPELSGVFSIGPDGFIYLPEINEVLADGLTINDLRQTLISKYSDYVIVRYVCYR